MASGLESIVNGKLRSLGGRVPCASVEVLRFAQDDSLFRVVGFSNHSLGSVKLRRICRFVGKRCACSHVHRQECLSYLVDRGGDDDADADRHRAYQDR